MHAGTLRKLLYVFVSAWEIMHSLLKARALYPLRRTNHTMF